MALSLRPCPSNLVLSRRSRNFVNSRPFLFRIRSSSTSRTGSGSKILTNTETRKKIVLKKEKSPVQRAEELTARLGLEMAVAGLERLFKELDPGDQPPDSPSTPARPFRVAYQGVRGSYCQEAAAMAFPESLISSHHAFPCLHMEDAFSALEDRAADRAVVPAENSLDGPIDRNLDLLLRHPAVRIVGELVLPVNHCLLSLSGAPRSGIRRIVSHPQALSHCAGRLRAMDLQVEEVSNAADAARFVAEHRIADTAVIGSEIAAREFGLQVLERDFQDRVPGGNYNRFLELGLGPVIGPVGPEQKWKTTVAFSLEKGVSDMFPAMWILESHGFRVVHVDHRPNRSNPVRLVGEKAYFDYVFVVDLVNQVQGRESLEGAMDQLRGLGGFVRVLGTYKCTSVTRT